LASRVEQARAILTGNLLSELLNEYEQQQIAEWVNDETGQVDYHARVVACRSIQFMVNTKCEEIIDGSSTGSE
jgi:hypothetical protein